MQYIPAIQQLLRKATTEQLAMIYHFIRGLLAAPDALQKARRFSAGFCYPIFPGSGSNSTTTRGSAE